MGLEKATLSNIGGGLIGDVINIGFAASDFKRAKQEGNSTAVSAAKAAGSFAWGEFYYGGLNSVIQRSVIGKGIEAIPLKGLAGMVVKGGLNMGVMMALSMVPAAFQMAGAMYEHTGREMAKGYGSRGKLGSGHFDMTEAGYTMRQRSLNAIRSNGLNTQSVLGNEARTYYRNSI